MISEHCKPVESHTLLHIDATGCGDNFNLARYNCTDVMLKSFQLNE